MQPVPQSPPMSNPAPAKPVDAAEVRGQLVGKHVCPFCGVMRPDATQPCARCTLEDTPATRTATKQRIGPWFVLQARNPSAPGMKLATLQSLIRRGQITPRSIVRGPTTDQMWAFAANARGLSREFGLCYHCGEAIDPVATRCPHCAKTQDLPADADAMMETLAATGAAAMFPSPQAVASSPPTPPVDLFSGVSVRLSDTGMDGGTSLDLQAPLPATLPAVIPPADPRPRQPLVPARPLVQRAAVPVDREESILSARELATAFQLDFKPTGRSGGRGPRRPVRTLAALLLILLIAGGIVLGLREDWRTTTFTYAKVTWARLSAKLEQPAKPTTFNPSTRPTVSSVRPTPMPNTPEPVKPPTSEPQVAPPPAPPAKPPEAVVIAPPPAAIVETPKPSVVTPLPPPEHVDVVPPADLTIDQATTLASDLRNKALDAQGRNDWPTAVKLYEQIQRLPRDAWPADLTMRLDLARKRAGG